MQRPPRALLALHDDPDFLARLSRVAERRFELRPVPGWEALPAAVRAAAPAGIVVVDPCYPQRDTLAPELRALLRSFPSATVVAALQGGPERVEALRALGEWGVAEVIDLASENSDAAVLQRLRSARGRALRSLLERGVPLTLPGRGWAILDAAVEVVAMGGHARDLARTLGLSRDTLLRWCRQSSLPVPRRLLLWMRLLMACELLDDPGQTVLDVALACGYTSDDALRRALHGALRASPKALRRKGAFRTASAAFLKEMARSRADDDTAAAGGG